MNENIDYSDLKYIDVITAYFKNLKLNFLEEYPDKVEYGSRKNKVFVDSDLDDIPKKVCSVAEAIKLGYNNVDNITFKESKTIKRYKYDEI